MKISTQTVHEHERIAVSDSDIQFLNKYVPSIFTRGARGEMLASNYVGVLTLPSGSVLEILPKVPLTGSVDDEQRETRELFLKMLQCYRGTPKTSETAKILSLRNFNMLSYFIHMFLNSLVQLVHGGLARQYITEHDNLPYLKGRIEFKEHLRLNVFNKTRFYSSFGELSVNRPVNRLIVTTLNRLQLWVDSYETRKVLKDLQLLFADVSPSRNVHADWNAHHIDRSMPHYTEIMKWIGLFLFGHGLATYSGQHSNIGLLFPMEKIFEAFITKNLRQYAEGFQVHSQGPRRSLVSLDGKEMFFMKPDITLKKQNEVQYVLDAKWKEIDSTNAYDKFQIAQSDLYQLFTYGKKYSSKASVLIYPLNENFRDSLRFQFIHEIPLICFPFDIRDTKTSVDRLIKEVIQSEVS